MNEDKELEEAVKALRKTVESNNEVIKEARKNGDINVMKLTADLDNQSKAIETVLKALKNSIPKKKIEQYLAEETEKYEVYKKEVDKNENLRGQLWHHMGAKNMCEKILGIEKKVTLD